MNSLKYILIGNSGVGKTCILYRYVNDQFQSDHETTIGVEYGTKIVTINNQKTKLHIWDTAGQERFHSIIRGYYRGTHGVIIVYDITDIDSFNNVEYWLGEVNKYSTINPKIILVGNKCDMETKREVFKGKGQQLADKYKISFFEVSAKKETNINLIFTSLTNEISKNTDFLTTMSSNINIQDTSKKNFCCKS